MLVEFEGVAYETGARLTAFEQLSISRKLAPAMPVVDGMLNQENMGKEKDLLVILLLSQVSDEASEQVVRMCLKNVSRQQPTGFAKLCAPTGQLMFTDLTMSTMLGLTYAVIEENLGDFFRSSLAALNVAAAGVDKP
jgi:hypothetical protein